MATRTRIAIQNFQWRPSRHNACPVGSSSALGSRIVSRPSALYCAGQHFTEIPIFSVARLKSRADQLEVHGWLTAHFSLTPWPRHQPTNGEGVRAIQSDRRRAIAIYAFENSRV